ncbi:MAG: VCBS repeat-containing protein [Thermodesulfobacteriota bacterium]|nr:VCBS repeat-containing protein [Thermodesulfobacteriota bacterium]
MKTLVIFLTVLLSQIFLVGFLVAASVQPPEFVRQIKWTGTSWFASPIVHNLGTNSPKIIGTFYDIFVWDTAGNELARARHGSGYPHPSRIYAPAVCADLEGDGIYEIVVGSGDVVAAYEWKNANLVIKDGWPASVCSAGQCPETRGLAAADLDNDGTIEIVATTTQTESDGAQVFVFSADGSTYQPPGLNFQAWPRYNTATGPGNDADSNGQGNHGYGSYGLNVGIGNLDDDPEKEIVVTFDNHQINVFQHTGVSMLSSSYFTNRDSSYRDNRLNWGQFIRWFDADVEHDHYHLHTGTWPHPDNKKWMQWTASPPSVADINGDGQNEVVGVANVEKDTNPYDTKHHSIMVLQGSYGNEDRAARRLSGWEVLPSSGYPLNRGTRSWYPPRNPPAPTIVNISGDTKPEILYAAHDGYIYCTSATATEMWKLNIRHDRAMMYASEIMVADLNQDNIPELILTTYGDPDNITPGQPHGYLMILDNQGNILYDIQLPQQGTNGNGKGAPAAPTVMDTNGDGTLEILIQTFGVGFFTYTVPGSAENQLLWPTARGNFLRDGRSSGDGRIANRPGRFSLAPIYILLQD